VNRQRHPDGAKAQARTIFEAHGSRRAAEVTGLPRRTINAWAAAEDWQRPGQPRHLRVAPSAEARPAAGKTGVPAGYSLARRVLLRRLGDTASLALDQVEAHLRAGHTVKARDAMVVAGIAVQRAEELAKAAGPAAGGQPDPAELVGRLRELATDLRTRKANGGRPG
jgi:hypothetical protein